ncbi:MAG: hypothetical protein HOI95_29815 [Chromatiales bacterium]|jgi:hypothetical protein|nr:hypothetical protein [Chromatiales bacterium]
MELTAIPPSTHLHTLAAAADPALRTSRPSEAVEETAQTTARRGSRPSSQPLSDQETQARVRELAKRDREVRAHEQAHASVGGAYASSPRFQYERGPNGVRYAVSGHVNIDVSTVPGDPQATLAKMLVVQRAALAPVGPSNADRAVAARAARQAAEARIDIASESNEADTGSGASAANGPDSPRPVGNFTAGDSGASAPPGAITQGSRGVSSEAALGNLLDVSA